jgi:hypothetical protein
MILEVNAGTGDCLARGVRVSIFEACVCVEALHRHGRPHVLLLLDLDGIPAGTVAPPDVLESARRMNPSVRL